MDRVARLAFLVAALPLLNCANMNKQCFGDGACRTERDGVVSWEGPPEAVAKHQAKENAEKQAAAAADKAFAEAPKRGTDEPIRLVLVGPSATNSDLEPLTGQYRNMLEQALHADSRVTLVPYSKVKSFFEPDVASSFGNRREPITLNEALTRKLRNSQAEVDVILVAQISPKKTSGFVKGAGLTAAEVNNVEFTANLSSIYKFNELAHSEVGKSTDTLNMAGINNGKKGSVAMKGKRNVDQDREAVGDYAKWVIGTIKGEIAASLPSISAAAAIRSQLASKSTETSP